MEADYSISRILVPLDGSEYGLRALPWAMAIAGDSATLMLLEITPAASEVRDFRGHVISSRDDIAERYRDLAMNQLQSAKDTYLADNERVELLVSEGDPTEQVLWNAKQHRADMIVMSSHGRGTIGRFASGSVADRIMRHAPLPVTVVGPDTPSSPGFEVKRIVAPVDDSTLSRGAVPVAAALAKATDSELLVVNVVPNAVIEFATPQFDTIGIPDDAYVAQQQEWDRQSETLVESIVNECESLGVSARGATLRGSVTEELDRLAKPWDLIVIASHGRSGLQRWVIGSNAMKLIRKAAASVTVVTREFLEAVEPSAE